MNTTPKSEMLCPNSSSWKVMERDFLLGLPSLSSEHSQRSPVAFCKLTHFDGKK